MSADPYHVLFLCTGNSARSILAEAILTRFSAGKFVAHSAGSQPKGQVHPLALELLAELNLPTNDLRSKSWDEFAGTEAPHLDFVFTVCGNAAGEVCPIWSAQPISAHWGVDDPAAVADSDTQKRVAFKKAFYELEARIRIFTNLSITSLDRTQLKERLDQIGQLTSNDKQ